MKRSFESSDSESDQLPSDETSPPAKKKKHVEPDGGESQSASEMDVDMSAGDINGIIWDKIRQADEEEVRSFYPVQIGRQYGEDGETTMNRVKTELKEGLESMLPGMDSSLPDEVRSVCLELKKRNDVLDAWRKTIKEEGDIFKDKLFRVARFMAQTNKLGISFPEFSIAFHPRCKKNPLNEDFLPVAIGRAIERWNENLSNINEYSVPPILPDHPNRDHPLFIPSNITMTEHLTRFILQWQKSESHTMIEPKVQKQPKDRTSVRSMEGHESVPLLLHGITMS